MASSKPLAGKVALITGSTSGIGKGIAECLAKQGCHVVINGFGDPAEIQKMCETITSLNDVKAVFCEADLTKVSDIEKLQQDILRQFPEGLDILVNNAGIQHVSPVESFPTEKWDFMISLMLTAPFHLIRLFLPRMKEKGWGRIINISSAHGHVASPNKSAYVSAKHGLIGLTKCVAVEIAGTGVTCNAICPGYVETPLFVKQAEERSKQKGISYNEAKSEIVSVHPSKSPVTVQQVGEISVFLCSPAADQMIGTSVTVDGGWTAH